MEWDDGWRLKVGTTGGSSDAADITVTPAGNIASTDVQAALEELDAAITAGGIANVVEDLTPQLGGDLDPNTFGPSGAWVPNAANTYALGTTGEPWSDLFLGSGAVINFDSGNATITHSAGTLTFGASLARWSATNALPILGAENTTDGASVPVLRLEGNRATMAANDEAYMTMRLSDSAGNQDEFARLTWKGTNVTSTTEAGQVIVSVATAGSLATALTINPTSIQTAGTIELGAASDTTLSRSAAGVLAVEGERVLTALHYSKSAGATTTAANTTPVSVTGAVFSYVANGVYRIWVMGRLNSAAATTGANVHFDLSSAVTAIDVQMIHALAAGTTGTLTGGYSISDDASEGASSGVPAGPLDVPVTAFGLLVCGANAGTAQLRLRSETTAVTELLAGTVMVVERLA